MKRKTYVKKMYALMQAINKKNIEMFGKPAENWGKVLKGIQRIGFANEQAPKVSSYAEAWALLENMRKEYGM